MVGATFGVITSEEAAAFAINNGKAPESETALSHTGTKANKWRWRSESPCMAHGPPLI